MQTPCLLERGIMFLVEFVPVAISEPQTFSSVDGDVTTHTIDCVCPGDSAEGWKERVQVRPELVGAFNTAMKAQAAIRCKIREAAYPKKSGGAWIKRVVVSVES